MRHLSPTGSTTEGEAELSPPLLLSPRLEKHLKHVLAILVQKHETQQREERESCKSLYLFELTDFFTRVDTLHLTLFSLDRRDMFECVRL